MNDSIVFFNTLARKKEPFSPHSKNKVSVYTCGPTVYNFAHIGNLRTYIFEDLFKRTLLYFGYGVKHVMNITDVDDKTIREAVRQNKSLIEYTEEYTQAFFEDLKKLNIIPADTYPKATDHVKEMIEMIVTLLEKGKAYKGVDGSIYFSIREFSDYGKLSHLKLDELKENADDRLDQDEYDKDSASDFVLWKHYDPERDGQIYWDSPFGKGRPGWHIECSAMAIKHLGKTIDVHMGGVDNIFPHHENEIAQSECTTCKPFAKLWMHSEHLLVDGRKMSKSAGNFFTLRDLLDKGYQGPQIRYLLLQTHYKTQLNFTFEGLDAAQSSINRIQALIERLHEAKAQVSSSKINVIIENTITKFEAALADDLNISVSLAALFDFIREVNIVLDQKQLSTESAQSCLEALKKMDQVLGIMNFESNQDEIPHELIEALDQRQHARKNKDWAEADRLRDLITEKGFSIVDTPEGPKLKRL